MRFVSSALPFALGLVLCPLMLGIVTRVKAVVGGRAGPPLLQRYRDLAKLLGKGTVYSQTTTAVFRLAPVLSLGAMIAALTMVPLGRSPALVHFSGDIFVVMGLLAVGRFVTMLAALDTGSPFEGMGASREAQFGALSEPVTFLAIVAVARLTHATSFTDIFATLSTMSAASTVPVIAPVVMALLSIYLVENSRMPVDDPTTHLELTMVHEVMILDHSGPDLAFIEYGAALKHWLLGAVLVGMLPILAGLAPWPALGAALGCLLLLSVLLGLIESRTARMRLLRVPAFVLGAGAATAVAFLLTSMVLP